MLAPLPPASTLIGNLFIHHVQFAKTRKKFDEFFFFCKAVAIKHKLTNCEYGLVPSPATFVTTGDELEIVCTNTSLSFDRTNKVQYLLTPTNLTMIIIVTSRMISFVDSIEMLPL